MHAHVHAGILSTLVGTAFSYVHNYNSTYTLHTVQNFKGCKFCNFFCKLHIVFINSHLHITSFACLSYIFAMRTSPLPFLRLMRVVDA